MRQPVENRSHLAGNWIFSESIQSFRSYGEEVSARYLSTGYFCIDQCYTSTFRRLTFFYKTELLLIVRRPLWSQRRDILAIVMAHYRNKT